MTATKDPTVATRCLSPLVLFGIDSRGKPQGARFRKEHAKPGLESRNPVAAQRAGQQRPKGRRDCRAAASWPGSCDRPHHRHRPARTGLTPNHTACGLLRNPHYLSSSRDAANNVCA